MGYKVINEFDMGSSRSKSKPTRQPTRQPEQNDEIPRDSLLRLYHAFARTYATILQDFVSTGSQDINRVAYEVIDLCEFVTLLKMEIIKNPRILDDMEDAIKEIFRGAN